jgi:hypothetical protein
VRERAQFRRGRAFGAKLKLSRTETGRGYIYMVYAISNVIYNIRKCIPAPIPFLQAAAVEKLVCTCVAPSRRTVMSVFSRPPSAVKNLRPLLL